MGRAEEGAALGLLLFLWRAAVSPAARGQPGVRGVYIPREKVRAVSPALGSSLASVDAKPTAYAAPPTWALGPALNRLRGRRLVHQLLRGCLAI